MNIRDFDAWYRSFLDIDGMSAIDDSVNGIQVGRSDSPIRKVAFAVDACIASIQRARDLQAQVLFVHHGMFWGRSERVDRHILARVRLLIENDMALCACHLPLDCHPECGNNAVLARMLKLESLEPFGRVHGKTIGFKGFFSESMSLEEVQRRILPSGSKALSVLAFGPREIRSAAVVSGGAPFEAFEAADQGLDLFVTGDASHSIYRFAEERALNVLCAGHYATEVWGVKAVAEKLSRETGLESVFIELPTGL